MPPSSLLPAARSVFVVSAEVHPAEQSHFVIFQFKYQRKKKEIIIKINRDNYVEQGISQSFPHLMKMTLALPEVMTVVLMLLIEAG